MSVASYINYCGLSMIGCCFKSRKGFMPGNVYDGLEKTTEEVQVILDTSKMGNECVIVKNGKRICGTGSALANVQIVQDKCYFEVKIQSSGIWAVGIASAKCDLNKFPLGSDAYSWVLRSDGSLAHNNIDIDKIPLTVSEGDYLGCSFDHVELNFFLNGRNLHCPITNIKGTIYPIISVDDGCIIDANFDHFVFPPPPGFQKLMVEKDLL